MNNFIFLDIDGVLNNDTTTAKSPNGYVGLSDKLLKRLKAFKKDVNGIIILTSTWKDASKEDYDYMMRKLRKFDCVPLGRTYEKVTKGEELRGQGIEKYIKDNEITNYVIFDDCLYDFDKYPDIMKRLVFVNYHFGLTDEDVENAKKILSNEKVEIGNFEEGSYHR